MANSSLPQRSRRSLQTPWTVKALDQLAHGIITLGGVGAIAAVSLVCIFLVWMVLPLFLSSKTGDAQQYSLKKERKEPVHLGPDEYGASFWSLLPDGSVRVFLIGDQETRPIREESVGAGLTAWSFGMEGESVALGYADGTVRLGRIGFQTEFLAGTRAGNAAAHLGGDAVAAYDGMAVQRTPEGQLRAQNLRVALEDPIDFDPLTTSSVVLIDHVVRPQGSLFGVYTEDGRLRVSSLRSRRNLITGETTHQVENADLMFDSHRDEPPAFLKVDGLGANVYLIWRDGRLIRFYTRDLSNPHIVQRMDLLERGSRAEITSVGFLAGRSTLVCGDSAGRVQTFFLAPPKGSESGAKRLLTLARTFHGPDDSPVTTISASTRMRAVLAGFANGELHAWHTTSGKRLSMLETDRSTPVAATVFSPRDDAILAASSSGLWRWDFDRRYPEASFRSLFLPVWYEGYSEPQHIWQSSAASDDLEPKYGMMPLIFGTLKATIYSMLFALPLALLAAIYTSEFMKPQLRGVVKPAIEMMASLPSVVLGFFAALVLAPFVEEWLAATLLSFVTVPLAFFAGAYLWQLIPRRLGLWLSRWRLTAIAFALPIGLGMAVLVAPVAERTLFEGNLRHWLSGRENGFGSAFGGWLLLLIPMGAVAATIITARWISPMTRQLSQKLDECWAPLLDLIKFLVASACTLGIATAGAWLLGRWMDPRGGFIDTYVQRNALIVGFAMGFAIIPIIYTIAEDALSSVPTHLRSASLGAGATTWQTTIRIVVPTAMSGLFSAAMIGLGRAVGETMIVLMAAGNTPLMDLNIFNGFRTLSANIAVEMPEAARNSTHFRTLFLAALVLFAMTFIVNTVAEIVRLRFRRKAVQL